MINMYHASNNETPIQKPVSYENTEEHWNKLANFMNNNNNNNQNLFEMKYKWYEIILIIISMMLTLGNFIFILPLINYYL